MKDILAISSAPDIKPFSLTRRADLTAANVKKLSDSLFVIFEDRTPAGLVRIVRNFAPFVMRRTDIGAPTESAEIILPDEVDGWVSFDPQVDGQSVLVTNIDMNALKDIGGTLNNNDRAYASGVSCVSPYPNRDALDYNPLFSFPIESKKELSFTFRLMQLPLVSPISGPYEIGGTGSRRIDFAGVVVTGVQMPVTTYNKLQETGVL